MKHWAYDLVGLPYEPDARGPASFNCVGLVWYYFKHRHGLDLPVYSVQEGSSTDLLRFVRATGWRRAAGRPQDEDILVCRGLFGRHVGVVVKTRQGLGLLHAEGSEGRGCVAWQPLDTLFGYRDKEYWRMTC